jgi:hypothetical protein
LSQDGKSKKEAQRAIEDSSRKMEKEQASVDDKQILLDQAEKKLGEIQDSLRGTSNTQRHYALRDSWPRRQDAGLP